MFDEIENDEDELRPKRKRKRRYDIDRIVSRASEAYGVPENLIHAVIEQESNYNPDARSHMGAMGLMQLMPGTAKQLGVKDPLNPIDNVFGGAKYLRDQLDTFDWDVDTALAAYNAGPGNARSGKWKKFKETRNYVPSVKARMRKRRSLMDKFGDAIIPSAEAAEPDDISLTMQPEIGDIIGEAKKPGLEEYIQEDLASPWNYLSPAIPGMKAVGRLGTAMWRGISEYIPKKISSAILDSEADDTEDDVLRRETRKRANKLGEVDIASTIGEGLMFEQPKLTDIFPSGVIGRHPTSTAIFAGVMPFIADPLNLVPFNVGGKASKVGKITSKVDDFTDDLIKRGLGDFADNTISAPALSEADDIIEQTGGLFGKQADDVSLALRTSGPDLPTIPSPRNIATLEPPPPGGSGYGGIGGEPPSNMPVPYIHDYIKQQREILRKTKEIEHPGFFGRVANYYKEFKKKIVDVNAPIEDAISSMEKKYNFQILPSERTDYSHMVDRVYRTPELSKQFMVDNGLVDIIRDVDDYGEFNEFLKSVRLLENYKNDPSTAAAIGRDLAMDNQIVAQLQSKYKEPAIKIFQYTHKLKQHAVDSGLISKELSQILDEMYPYYVPLNRVQDAIEFSTHYAGGRTATASIAQQTAFRKMLGSKRVIEDPLEMIVEKTNTVFAQAERNKAAQALVGLREIPYFKGFFRELSPVESAEHTVSFLDNGVKRTFETLPEFAIAAKNLNYQQLSTLQRMWALPVRVARLGTTGINPAFTASNLSKDLIFSGVNSPPYQGTLANPVNWIRNFARSMGSAGKAMWHSVFHGSLYDDMVRAGAGGTIFDTSRGAGASTVEQIRSTRGIFPRVKYAIRHPSQLLEWVENIVGRAEQFNRIRNFDRVRSQLLSNGASKEHATVLAAKASRDSTINFYRHGEWGSVLNTTWMYMNAGIQGTRTLLRSLKNAPVRTIARLSAGVFLPVGAAVAWNMKDEKRKKAYLDIKDDVRQNNIIIFPPGEPTKDEQGNWNAAMIPLPPGISNLASVVRRFVEQAYEGDPVNAQEIAAHLLGSVNPAGESVNDVLSFMIPQQVKPMAQWLANYDFFRGQDVVPYHMTKLPPEMQKFDYTSGTAKEIAGLLDAPPIKVEKLAYDIFGSIAPQALHLSDLALSGLGVIDESEVHGRSTPEAVAARFTKARGGRDEQLETERLQEYETQQAGVRYVRNQDARQLVEKLNSPDEAIRAEGAREAGELRISDPAAYKTFKRQFRESKRGIAIHERMLKGLSVQDGLRAKAIMDRLSSMEDSDEKEKYLNDLKKKGILNKVVFNQMEMLMEE